MFFNVGRLGLILITRRRARALAKRASSQENLGLSPSSNEWPHGDLMVSWFMKRWSEKETVFLTGTRTVVTDFTRHVALLD